MFILSNRLLKKSLNMPVTKKFKASQPSPVNAGLYKAFKPFSFAAVLAKLWLLSPVLIQNYARDHFQAFALTHTWNASM